MNKCINFQLYAGIKYNACEWIIRVQFPYWERVMCWLVPDSCLIENSDVSSNLLRKLALVVWQSVPLLNWIRKWINWIISALRVLMRWAQNSSRKYFYVCFCLCVYIIILLATISLCTRHFNFHLEASMACCSLSISRFYLFLFHSLSLGHTYSFWFHFSWMPASACTWLLLFALMKSVELSD